MATGTKRALDDASGTPKTKRSKIDNKHGKRKSETEKPVPAASTLVTEDVDFPRGGGSSFTPLEVKTIRAEAAKEADQELFKESKGPQAKKRKLDTKGKKKAAKDERAETIRVEHLNYKRVAVGMKILGLVMSVEPLALIVSLPNQLMAHVPITNISSQLTHLLESMGEDEDISSEESNDEEATTTKSHVPELYEIFQPGQYVRAVVTAVRAQGSTDPMGFTRSRDEAFRASARIELSLLPEKINEGLAKADLKPGLTLSAAIKSVEDHGYALELGVPDIAGFLPFKDVEKASPQQAGRLRVGCVLDVSVSKMSPNGRTCTFSTVSQALRSSSLSEVSNVASVLPGALVQGLVTAVLPTGLNLQILGFYNGTIDQFHLPAGDVEENFKVGQKVKARVLYDITPSTPPRFALSLAAHILSLTSKPANEPEDGNDSTVLHDGFPIGTVLDSAKVIRVESERGLTVSLANGLEGFVHISQASDDHVPSLSATSGPWKVGTIHRARVTGYYPFDGLLQLSMRSSVLEQKFLQVGELQVGEVMKGTVKKLTDSALFLSISGNVDGVVWPNHYADIALKHPQKRFKPGGSVRCRVLVIDPTRKRVVLTCKKTLVESTLPVVASMDDAKEGIVTHAVVFKTSEKSLQVEFYNNLKAIVPFKEASEATLSSLSEAFPIGKVVQVRITSVEPDTGRIVASIRQAAPNFKSAMMAIEDVEIGHSVEGIITEVQKEKAVVTLHPTQVRALLSLHNLANRRDVTVAQLRTSLKVGDKIQDLVVTLRNPETGFVLIATKPKEKEALVQKHTLSIDTVQVGQIVGGRVLRHTRHGALVKLTSHITGMLHPTDTCDDYENGNPFPAAGSIIKAAVIAIDKEKNQLTLSTRRSRMHPDQEAPILDKEIDHLAQLQVGSSVRGFIKSVAEHGLFVMLGRGIDARLQIKELFDEYVKDWKSRFTANQLVKGRILSVDKEKRQVEMTFRSGESSRSGQPSLKLGDLVVGSKVDGTVKKIEDYGLFVEIEGSKLRGLCHKSEVLFILPGLVPLLTSCQLSDNQDADVVMALRSFREGDRVKVKILSVDTEKHRISLGLKPSYFAEDDFTEASDEDQPEEPQTLGVIEDEEDELSEHHEDDSDDDAMVVDEADIGQSLVTSLAVTQSMSARSDTSALRLESGFNWSAEQDMGLGNVSDLSEDDEDDEEQGAKKKKRRRKEIEQDLTAELHTKVPDSNADFERVLLGSPNSSYLWIQYMSFQLQLSEVEKAREIAKRALKTINFREEQERLNVWIALLNLENVYGTEESLDVTFKDAARHNDSKTIHLKLAAIFDQSEKFEKAEEQYQRTCKKFGQSSKVWTLFGEHYFRRGKLEEARKLLPRSLQSLEKRKHLKTISKFAQLEYKLGDPERGKTIFEGIVDSHPKRWDLWSIYLDMEAAQGNIASLRNIFDRVLTLKMTSHKAKAFFKKWLEIERCLGDEEGAEAVKAKAVEWTQRATSNS
ncbi:hypothetical protein NM688_g5035 [Phlebia brevispora]|uniref:Uncharacterized protein n=1 Tax=Phlebia brevispora TaxID=194682 RepID=A0ACC1T177_9APHY|nr:hypothetical protein NM688_g5035 [Phlebia brevispora]